MQLVQGVEVEDEDEDEEKKGEQKEGSGSIPVARRANETTGCHGVSGINWRKRGTKSRGIDSFNDTTSRFETIEKIF